jgi:hypothetical protein
MKRLRTIVIAAGAAACLGLLWPASVGAQPPGGRGDRPGRGGPPPERPLAGMFDRWDANEDGKLTEDEVPEGVWNRLSRADADGDGAVTREELAAMAGPGRAGGFGRGQGPPPAREEDQRERPRREDTPREEARKVRPPREEARPRREDVERSERDRRGPGQDRVDALFSRLDRDGDGVLTKEEFAPMVARLEAMARGTRQGAGSMGRPGPGPGRGPSGPAWGGRAWGGPPPMRGGAIWWGAGPRGYGFGPHGWWQGGRGYGPQAMSGPPAMRGMGRGPAMEGPRGGPGPWGGQRSGPGPRAPRGGDRQRPEREQEQEQEQD